MKIDAYPCLRADSADYENPDSYTVQLQQTGTELDVTHSLTEAHCLPAQWLRAGLADLCCEVRLPHMLYSERQVASRDALQVPESGEWKYRQRFPLPEAGSKNLYFLPTIVLRAEQTVTLDSAKHNVSQLWHGRKVRFPKGAVLAGGTVFEDLEKVFHLIRFEQSDVEPGSGTLRSSGEPKGDNWQFVVWVPKDVMEALEVPQHQHWVEALYIGCFSQMLNEIKVEFKSVEYPPYDAVRGLGELLREKAGVAPPWETDKENEEWRDTLHLATVLRGLRAPGLEENGE